MDKEAWCAVVHGVTTDKLNWTDTYNVIFIHLFVDRHLVCFHILVIYCLYIIDVFYT